MARILIIEDDDMSRDMLARRLVRRGHDVSSAADGSTALEMIASEELDLVLLDIIMPGMNGLEALKRIRENNTIEELPVIMVTAKDQSEDIVKALENGANDYITKPVDFSVAMARIQTQLSLRQLSRLKDEFLRMASHDLKNPLMIISLSAYNLSRQIPDNIERIADLKKHVANINESANVMTKIITDFLDFQAIEDGQLKLAPGSVDFNSIVREVAETNAGYANSKNIVMAYELDSGLPGVSADGARISQVIQNFVSNAIKFGPPDSRVVLRSLTQGKSIQFEVIDSGPGFTEEDLRKTFVKYAKLSNKPTGGEKSSGLGLAICKQLVELHGGEIGVRNNVDKGATFWFSLPLTEQA